MLRITSALVKITLYLLISLLISGFYFKPTLVESRDKFSQTVKVEPSLIAIVIFDFVFLVDVHWNHLQTKFETKLVKVPKTV